MEVAKQTKKLKTVSHTKAEDDIKIIRTDTAKIDLGVGVHASR